MEGNDDLDMTNASTKFCVSWLTIRVCCSQFYCGLEFTEHRVVEAASKYLGYLYSSDNRTPQTTALPPSVVPTVSEMVALYCQGGRRLTPEHTFGILNLIFASM